MRKLLLCSTAAIAALAVGPAVAADMGLPPVYKSAPIVSPAWNWSGFYVGVNGGGGFASADFLDPDCFTCANTKFQTPFGMFGGQLGYNWQWHAMVVGIEGDLNWTSVNATKNFATDDGSELGTVSFKMDALASIRGRMGLAYENALVYVTAGPAFGHFNSNTTLTGIDTEGCQFRGAGATCTASDNTWHTGLAVGAGIEYMPISTWQNWVVRGEFLYYVFPDVEAQLVPSTGGTTGCSTSGGVSVNCRMNYTYSAAVARVGVSYKFGGLGY